VQLITATLWEPSRSLIKKKPEQQRQHTLYITLKFSGGVNIPFIPGNKKAPLTELPTTLLSPVFNRLSLQRALFVSQTGLGLW
jgi:hypothetical protein